jgi:ketosteroid isomerase-like protein
MSARLDEWMAGYIAAWRSNEPAAIAALFTEDAVYDPQTGAPRWEGRDAIVAGWIDVGDEPGTWQFTWSPLVESDDVAVVTGETHYDEDPPKTYRNLWVIDFGEGGRCRSFTEWYVRVRKV